MYEVDYCFINLSYLYIFYLLVCNVVCYLVIGLMIARSHFLLSLLVNLVDY